MSSRIRLERFRSVENLLPIFELLEQSTNLGAKEEALRILAQISEDKDCRIAISQAGGIITLVEILKSSPVELNTLVASVVRVIRNLANDGAALRKSLRQCNATQYLVQLISQQEEEISVSVDAIAAIGYLAHHDQQTKGLIRKMGGVPLLVRILHGDANKAITCYAAAALHNLIDGSVRNKNAVLAAGAVPRLVQLLDSEIQNPILEVTIRTIQKLCEKYEQAQADVRRSKGLSKLIELQAKVNQPTLLNWIEQCLQALKMSEKETNESKLLLSLGTAFQKEFEQLKVGSNQVLNVLGEMNQSMTSYFQQLIDRMNALDEENTQLKDVIVSRDHQIGELNGLLDEKTFQLQNTQDLIQEKEHLVQEAQERLNEKENELTDCLNSMQQKETYLSKVESVLQEKEKQLKVFEATLEEKTQHINYIEALVYNKETQIETLQAEERSNTHKTKIERDGAIIDLIQSLRDVISVSNQGCTGTSQLDQHQICEISDSIQSLLQSSNNTQTPDNFRSNESPSRNERQQMSARKLATHSPLVKAASVPVKTPNGMQEGPSSPLFKQLSSSPKETQLEESSNVQKSNTTILQRSPSSTTRHLVEGSRGALASPLSRAASYTPQWRHHHKQTLN